MFLIGRCKVHGPTKRSGCTLSDGGSGSCATLPVRRSLRDRPTRRSSLSQTVHGQAVLRSSIQQTVSSGSCCLKAYTPCDLTVCNRREFFCRPTLTIWIYAPA